MQAAGLNNWTARACRFIVKRFDISYTLVNSLIPGGTNTTIDIIAQQRSCKEWGKGGDYSLWASCGVCWFQAGTWDLENFAWIVPRIFIVPFSVHRPSFVQMVYFLSMNLTNINGNPFVCQREIWKGRVQRLDVVGHSGKKSLQRMCIENSWVNKSTTRSKDRGLVGKQKPDFKGTLLLPTSTWSPHASSF